MALRNGLVILLLTAVLALHVACDGVEEVAATEDATTNETAAITADDSVASTTTAPVSSKVECLPRNVTADEVRTHTMYFLFPERVTRAFSINFHLTVLKAAFAESAPLTLTLTRRMISSACSLMCKLFRN